MEKISTNQLPKADFKQKCINFFNFLRSMSLNNIKPEVLNDFNQQQNILQLDQMLEVSDEKIMQNVYILLNYSDLSTDAMIGNYIDQFLASLQFRDHITLEDITKLKRYLEYFREVQFLLKSK